MSLTDQAAGGGMASSADTKAQQDVRRSLRDRANDVQTGTHLMVAGTPPRRLKRR